MKVQAQPHSFSFQTQEEFFEKYTQIILGEKYQKYQELKSVLTPQEINQYTKDKEKYQELKSERFRLNCQLKRGNAQPEKYNKLEELDTAMNIITFDKKVQEFSTLEEKVKEQKYSASIVRSAYIESYNPQDRKILYLTGPYAPHVFQNLPDILQADGAIVKENWKDTENPTDTYQDIIYTGAEICGGERNGGKSTWPILNHAEKNDGYTLFFLDNRPLYEHCRTDQEITKVTELAKKGKKIMIFTSNYGNVTRFY